MAKDTMPLTQHQRELLAARICSGTVRLRVGGTAYLVKAPTPEQNYAAQEVFHDCLGESVSENLTDGEALEQLLAEGLWDDRSESLLKALPGEIDQFKHGLWKAAFRANERKTLRECLRAARSKLSELTRRRHALDHVTASGYACAARARFLMACTLCDARGERVFGDDFWAQTCGLLDEALAAHSAARLSESEFRELARTDPWRPVWSCRRAESGVFGRPPPEYSEEQRSLVSYSCLYDSVYEHPDCPADEVIADDDTLDGWLIEQRRQREARQGKRAGEAQLGATRDAQEVYVVADTPEDARRVMDMNDDHSRAVQRQRFAHLKERGEVAETDMPDTRRRLRMEATRMLAESVRR